MFSHHSAFFQLQPLRLFVLHPEGVYIVLDEDWVLELVGQPVHVVGDHVVVIDLFQAVVAEFD